MFYVPNSMSADISLVINPRTGNNLKPSLMTHSIYFSLFSSSIVVARGLSPRTWRISRNTFS